MRAFVRVALAVAIVALVASPSASLLAFQARAPTGGASPRTQVQSGPEPAASPAPTILPAFDYIPPINFTCAVAFGAGLVLGPFSVWGPGCGYAAANAQWEAFASSVEITSDKNIMTLLGNSLNITNAFVANLNATVQQLLNYYEQRAEAIVPFFLNGSWNNTVYDQIAIYSGLIPAIEGMVTAYASQEYQDWNATRQSWDNFYGPTGTFHANRASLEANWTGFAHPTHNNNTFAGVIVGSAGAGDNMTITEPWETWAASTMNGFSNATYFNLEPGGTVVCVDDLPIYGPNSCPTYRVTDVTKGTHFNVPFINRTNWFNGTGIPAVSTLHHIDTFDLLKLDCAASCSDANKFVEVMGGYAFRNASPMNPDHAPLAGQPGYAPYNVSMIHDTMIPEIFIGSGNFPDLQVPSLAYTLCIHEGDGFIQGACSTQKVGTEGQGTGYGTGPGSVAATNNSLTRFASTMQGLVNNTLAVAHAYWLTLHAATNNGEFPIPANCAIPFPSAAFPAAINPGLYRLNTNEILAGYWGYLEAVGAAFGIRSFPNGISFCGSSHLGIHFNWTGDWVLGLNVSAAVYLGLPNGTGAFPDGSWDPNETLTNPNTWPLHVHPILLFPAEFQTNVPVGQIYPVPFNDPLVALTVNWTGNQFYGSTTTSPQWGLPSYLNLEGYGNAIEISGVLSTLQSNRPNATGDAIEIQSCKLNGTAVTTCDLGVTYFNNFTYGHVNGLLGPISPPSSGGGGFFGALGTTCGFQVLNAFYDGWLGYIGSAVATGFSYLATLANAIPIVGGGIAFAINGFGCLVAWIVVIVIAIGVLYLLIRIIGALFSRRRVYRPSPSTSRGGGIPSEINVNVRDQRRRRA